MTSGAGDHEPARVLVVDDMESNRTLLRRRLERLGYEVVEAEDGDVALRAMRTSPFDIVLLDINMPRVGGLEVLEQVSLDPRLEELPVLVVSAVDDRHSVARCIRLGAVDHLPKPIDSLVLRARVETSIALRRSRRQERTRTRELARARARAEELLGVILPPSILPELTATGTLEPRRYDEVAVLFCDAVGYTAWCDEHSAEEAVAALQALVAALEAEATLHGVEKIKTIGDAFMGVVGLAAPMERPIDTAIRAGLAMLDTVAASGAPWPLRLGVHVGPVVAGIIGTHRYQFDIWGDTVNVAARLQGLAPSGGLCVSAATAAESDEEWAFRDLGSFEVKGKGTMEVKVVSAGRGSRRRT